jgi:cytochrome c-type biogenesis protein CcmH/NrfF
MRARLLLATALAFLLAFPGAALAACPQTTLGDIEDEVMCTVCGTTLGLATEAPQALREREFILTQIEACRSKEEIKTALVAEFGPEVLATPSDQGFDLAAYLVPVAALGLGALAVGVAGLRWRRTRPATTASLPPAPSGPASSRLDADLERYEL